MVRNLHQLPELRESHFGRPPPRHGLNLLWWFAKTCVRIDSNQHMTTLYNPENGAFGFHRFFNREGLLPRTQLKYYEVGNLHSTDSLPQYVTDDYTGQLDDSNSDRVIVSYDSRWNRFDSIYVTRHSNQKKFDQNHTYCITFELLKLIKRMSREDFLKEISNVSNDVFINMESMETESTQRQRSYQSSHTNADECIKCVVVFFIFLSLLLWYVLQK